jgi:hypothetical protein
MAATVAAPLPRKPGEADGPMTWEVSYGIHVSEKDRDAADDEMGALPWKCHVNPILEAGYR